MDSNWVLVLTLANCGWIMPKKFLVGCSYFGCLVHTFKPDSAKIVHYDKWLDYAKKFTHSKQLMPAITRQTSLWVMSVDHCIPHCER
jgi:hypothetical protein